MNSPIWWIRPTGDEIAFVSNREPDPDRFFNYDLFAVLANVRVETRERRREQPRAERHHGLAECQLAVSQQARQAQLHAGWKFAEIPDDERPAGRAREQAVVLDGLDGRVAPRVRRAEQRARNRVRGAAPAVDRQERIEPSFGNDQTGLRRVRRAHGGIDRVSHGGRVSHQLGNTRRWKQGKWLDIRHTD